MQSNCGREERTTLVMLLVLVVIDQPAKLTDGKIPATVRASVATAMEEETSRPLPW